MRNNRNPVAWILARPQGIEANRARRLFQRLQVETDAGEITDPHLTLEIIYTPVVDPGHLAERLRVVAQQTAPFRVPAIGVYLQADFNLAVELALIPELLDLRARLACIVVEAGGTPYPAEDNWRPHLTVAPVDERLALKISLPSIRAEIEGYSFTVQSLTLSLSTGKPGEFSEIGPFPMSS